MERISGMRHATGFVRRAACLAAALFIGGAAMAAEERQIYDVYVGGIKSGTLGLSAAVEGNSYTAEGKIQTSGLLGALFEFAFSGTSRGEIRGDDRLVPVAYRAAQDDGDDVRSTTISYAGGMPSRVEIDPPRKRRKVPEKLLRDTVDPVAATFALLRPEDGSCTKQVEIFDGAKRSRITVSERRRAGEFWACSGTYTRVAGFSKRQMEERTNFPFTLFYRETRGGMEVARFETQSTMGTVSAVRR